MLPEELKTFERIRNLPSAAMQSSAKEGFPTSPAALFIS
jgi:hypothetical protein